MRLQDPELTKVIIVALAETTPSWKPPACNANSNAPRSHLGMGHQQLPGRRRADRTAAAAPRGRRGSADHESQNDYADRIALVPLLAVEPVGIPALQGLCGAQRTSRR